MPERLPLSLDSKITRNTSAIEAEIDGEIVAMNIETGNCYGLNLTGSRIWNLLTGSVRVERVCAQLREEYRVEREACEQQVLDLLEELRAEDLIQILPEK